MTRPTVREIVEARRRLAPYLSGYPEPMIDARRLRIANGTASERDRREVAAEDVVIAEIRARKEGTMTRKMTEEHAVRILFGEDAPPTADAQFRSGADVAADLAAFFELTPDRLRELARPSTVEELRREVGYDPESEEPDVVDDLIAYKDALEERLGAAEGALRTAAESARLEADADERQWSAGNVAQDTEEAEHSGFLLGRADAYEDALAVVRGERS